MKIAQLSYGEVGQRRGKAPSLYKRPRFFASSGELNDLGLLQNLDSFLKGAPVHEQKSAWTLAIDNVNLEGRPRYSTTAGPGLGGLKGVARESAFRGPLVRRPGYGICSVVLVRLS